MSSKRNVRIAFLSAAVLAASMGMAGCTMPTLGGGGSSSSSSAPSANVQQQQGTGVNRVSTTKRVGDESTGYVSVPVSYQEVGEGCWAERNNAFKSKIDGSTQFTEFVSMEYSISSYAIAGQTYLKAHTSDNSYRDVKSSNITFKGHAALEITSRLDESLYEKQVVFDAGAGGGGTRILTIIYDRNTEDELESVMDSWAETE